MTTSPESSGNVDEKIKAAQLEKVSLEVSALKNRTLWHNVIPLLVPVVTAVIAVAGFVFAVGNFAAEQRAQANERDARTEQEFRKRFWEERLALYRRASKLAATIATADSLDMVRQERREFWQLYWGELAIIEDKDVLSAMVAYGEELKRLEGKQQDPKGTSQASNIRDLRQLSYQLAIACRNSLAKTWEPIKLEPFPPDKPEGIIPDKPEDIKK
jgi:hypothetical protein